MRAEGRQSPSALCCIVCAAAALTACGNVGEPVYPSLNIPARITDLRAIEHGDKIIIDFTIPALTTDATAVRHVRAVELRAAGTAIPVSKTDPGPVHAETPAQPLAGQDVTLEVRLINSRGRASEWSNQVTMHVVPPLAAPSQLRAEDVAEGVRVSWSAPGENHFRVFRRGGEAQPVPIGESDSPAFVDKNIEYGKTYTYSVQAVNGAAESEIGAGFEITPLDKFPPAVPAGLTAATGVDSIELAWDRNTEPDFKAYLVYRSVENGPFEKIAGNLEAPAYTDKSLEAGKHYRYEVSAIDQRGNESKPSAPVGAAAP